MQNTTKADQQRQADAAGPTPSDAVVDSILAAANGQQAAGRHDEAEQLFRQVLQLDANQPVALHRLGVIAWQAGRTADALDLISKAVAANPKYVDAHLDLGTIYSSQSRFAEAFQNYSRALFLAPNSAEVHFRLAGILQTLGKAADAQNWYGKALAIDPAHVGALCALGKLLDEEGRRDEALGLLRKAVAVDPAAKDALRPLGSALAAAGLTDEAVDLYRRAIVLQPADPLLRHDYATLLHEAGRLEDAAVAYGEALAIKPDLGTAHRQLADLRKVTAEDETVKAMEAVYARPDLGENDRMHIAFGLGKAFDDLQDYDKAFGFYAEGNALKRKNTPFSMPEEAARYTTMRQLFSKEFLDRLDGAGDPDATPIFILGMPRSGTSLVEQILASHPDVHGGGELKYLSQSLRGLVDGNSPQFVEAVQRATSDQFAAAGARYLAMLRQRSAEARFITDKLPDNIRLVGFIKLALPNAKVIHCSRDPMANGLSLFKTLFAEGCDYSYDLADIGAVQNLYADLTAHYREVLPGFIHDVRYEDLVGDPEPRIRELLEFCGLDWNDACLQPHKTQRAVGTASATQVRSPIHNASVALWEKYGDHLAPLKAALR